MIIRSAVFGGVKRVFVAACLAVGLAPAPLHAAGWASVPSTGSTLFQCRPAPRVQPPPLLTATTKPVDTLRPPCPAGQVPQPAGRFALKGMPRAHHFPAPSGTSFLYADAYQYYTAIGTSASLSQHDPALSTSDYHSLAEVAAQSADGRQIVEVGWTVDRGLNHDSNPHLFVYHWINGQQTCYNGCGYVQYSKTHRPGMTVTVTSTPQQYAIEYFQGNWWIWYQNGWMGYFPGSLWGGGYTQLGLAQWFGEVAASSTAPCTDMGDGIFGTSPGSAVMTNISFVGGPSASGATNVTYPSYYNVGNFTGSSFNYGGPGAC